MTTSLAEAVGGIEELTRAIDQEQQSQELTAKRRAEAVRELGRRIKEGETTGDVLKDFLIVKYGLFVRDLDKPTPLHRVRDEMRQHVGEPILVIHRREDFHGCTGFGYEPRASDMHLDTTLTLGFLEDGEFRVSASKEELWIQVGKIHATSYDQRDPQTIDDDIHATYFTDVDVELHCKNPLNVPMGLQHLLIREIIVGHAAIDIWLELPFYKHLRRTVNAMARLLGKSIEMAPARKAAWEAALATLKEECALLLEERRSARERVIAAIELLDASQHVGSTEEHRRGRQLEERRRALLEINRRMEALRSRARELDAEHHPDFVALFA